MDELPDKGYQFQDRYEREAFEGLSLLGPGPAQMFRDACRIMSAPDDLGSATHLVGHLAREIFSAVRDVLLPIDYEKGDGDDEAKQKAKAILNRLGFVPTDIEWTFWLNEVEDRDWKLHSWAHRAGLGPPRPMTEVFKMFWKDAIQLLGSVMARAKDYILDIIQPLEVLAAKDTPTGADLKTIQQKLPHHEIFLHRFLNKISSVSWLPLLHSGGYFDNPPSSIRVNDGIQMPYWPQADLLARLAETDSKITADIICNINWPDNGSVVNRFIAGATVMDLEDKQRLATALLNWMKVRSESGPAMMHIEHSIGEFIGHLGVEGLADSGIDIAGILLRIKIPSKAQSVVDGLKVDIDEYVWGEVVTKHLLSCITGQADRVLRLLCDRLHEACEKSEFGQYKDSSFSRSFEKEFIGKDDNDHARCEVTEKLICGIRDAAVAAIKDKKLSIHDVINILDPHCKWLVFDRICIYLCAEHIQDCVSHAKKILMDRENFYADHLQAEFRYLLIKLYPQLSDRESGILLSWVARGPQWLKECDSDDEQQQRLGYWQYAFLLHISKYLDGEWKQKFIALKSDYEGRHAHREQMKGGRAWAIGSPIDDDEMDKMTLDEIQNLLQNWVNDRKISPRASRLELNRTFGRLVSKMPGRFSSNLEKFKVVGPDVTWHLIDGYVTAIREDRPFDWVPVFSFVEWAFDRSLGGTWEVLEPEDTRDMDHASAIRMSAMNFIAAVLRKQESCVVDISDAHRIWTCISKSCVDSDPSQERDAESSSSLGPYTQAINCVLGQAILNISNFFGWCDRSDIDVSSHTVEIRQVIDAYLLNTQRHRLSGHAAIGGIYPTLRDIDQDWAAGLLDQIFPISEPSLPQFLASWEGFTLCWNPGKEIFQLLRQQYAHVTMCVLSKYDQDNRDERHGAERTIQHFADAIAYGYLDFGDTDNLLEFFFENASEESRASLMRACGRVNAAEGSPIEFKQELGVRMRTMFDQRINELKQLENDAVSKDELWSVEEWGSHDLHPPEWWLSKLQIVLKITNELPRHPRHLDYTVQHISALPNEVLAVVSLTIRAKRERWDFYPLKKGLEKTFEWVKSSGNDSHRTQVRKLVSNLTSQGVSEFDSYRDI